MRATWGQQAGRRVLVLEPALSLAPSAIALPEVLAPLASLCDGTRDIGGLRASLMVRLGLSISEDKLLQILKQMDDALLFDNGRQAEARAEAMAAYRQGDSRRPVSAGSSYPTDAQEALRFLDGFLQGATEEVAGTVLPAPADGIRGIVSPHIDYPRGGDTYARTWALARPAVEAADLIIFLGTDHHGPDGSITLTRQRYRTPWGVLPNDEPALAAIVAAIGEEAAFSHELHHAHEHSIELALVWAHFIAPESDFSILPILCGSFSDFIGGRASFADHAGIQGLIGVLRDLVSSRRRVLIVAAADLAHVGPAFGGAPVGPVQRETCASADARLLDRVVRGSADELLTDIQSEGDRRNVCGVPPLCLLLRTLEPVTGVVVGYEQCPADAHGTSLVSIAGALVW